MIETEASTTAQVVDPALAGNRIVVGVDGSDGSLAALTWALHEARLRDAPVHVVLGWGYHPSWGGAGLGSMFPLGYTTSGGGYGGGVGGARISAPIEPPVHTAQNLEADAEALATRVLDQAISSVVDHDARSVEQSVQITRAAIPGHGAKVLLDEVTETDLLVVGSRGHGGFVGALLGSVSHHVVAQAACPVVVVPNRPSEASQ